MSDGDDPWSAEPDGEAPVAICRTPKHDNEGFDVETPRAPPVWETRNVPEPSMGPTRSRSTSSDRDAVAGLPRLQLETAHNQADGISGTNDPDGEADNDRSPETARPYFARAGSSSQRSPDLHVLASMYQPDDAQLVVADAFGTSFENVNLSTPSFEKFGSMDGDMVWTETRGKVTGKGMGQTTSEGFGWSRRPFGDASGSSHWQGQSRGHRKTSSDVSAATAASGPGADGRRASWFASAGPSAATFTGEPGEYENNHSHYRPRASTSSSSIADSVGTAGEAPDSDYEEQRSKSHSRHGSRRPSISGPPTLNKRLSSFAPIPSIGQSASQTSLALAAEAVADPPRSSRPTSPTSPARSSSAEDLKPTRQDTGSTLRAADMQNASSGQSTSSNVTSSSAASSSAPASRTSSTTGNGSITYTLPTTISSSEAFEKQRAENEKWMSKRKKSKPSKLDKVMSKTRPRDLPPKQKDEDEKHVKEYNEMLIASKQAAKKRATVRQAKKQAKEQATSQALPVWEKDILPNWKSVLRKDNLRSVWWSGTMPARHRSRFWQSCIGNGLVLGKNSYAKALALARSIEANDQFPEDVRASILDECRVTLPHTKLFQAECPLHKDLVELLQAICVFWKSDKVKYCHGMSFLAGMLLVYMPAQDAFLCLVNLINKSLLKTFYYGTTDDIEAYYRVFNTLLADKMPKIYRNFVSHDIRPSLFLHDWVTTLFCKHLALDSATRAWDIYVLEGDQFLFRLALAVLQILEARLFNPDHRELTELFMGKDKGAVAIVAREQNKHEGEVWPEEVYDEMGVVEDTLFEVVQSMEWKEATFQRLLSRELPEAD